MPNVKWNFDLRFIFALVGLLAWVLSRFGVEVPIEVREYLLIILVTLLCAPVRRSPHQSPVGGIRVRPRFHLRRGRRTP